jgi:hypothetical protein
MPDYSNYMFTGEVTRIIKHNGQVLIFIIKQTTAFDDLNFVAYAGGIIADFLSGKVRPGEKVMGTGAIVLKDKELQLQIKTLFSLNYNWGGRKLAIKKPRQQPRNMLYNPDKD